MNAVTLCGTKNSKTLNPQRSTLRTAGLSADEDIAAPSAAGFVSKLFSNSKYLAYLMGSDGEGTPRVQRLSTQYLTRQWLKFP